MRNLICLIAFTFLLFAAACIQRQEARDTILPKTVSVKPIGTTPVAKDTLCIAAVGDMMLGTSFPDSTYLPLDGGRSSFAPVKKYLLDAEFAFGNLEGTLLDKGNPGLNKRKFTTRQFYFRMPTTYTTIFKDAGFKLLSLANNHSGDFADSGRMSTMRTLDNARINYAGLVVCPSVQFQINGVKYGFCAFAPNSGTASIYDLKRAAQTISDLKQQCDIVIVSFHGGGEGPEFEHVPPGDEIYHGEPRGNVRAFAHNAINAGADMVLGHGPHVSRAMELYNQRLIAYSLGNFCTYKSVSIAGVCGIAPLLRVKINRKGEFINAQIISTQQSRINGLSVDTLNRAAKRMKWLTEVDFQKNGLQITEDGSVTPTTNVDNSFTNVGRRDNRGAKAGF